MPLPTRFTARRFQRALTRSSYVTIGARPTLCPHVSRKSVARMRVGATYVPAPPALADGMAHVWATGTALATEHHPGEFAVVHAVPAGQYAAHAVRAGSGTTLPSTTIDP